MQTTSPKVKKLFPDAIIPKRADKGSAGFDLFAYIPNGESKIIPPYQTVKIGTGIAITPPMGCFGAIFARSGLATKEGLRPANCTGVADESYTGEYIVALYNDSNNHRLVEHGQRIAQLVFIPYISLDFEEVDDLGQTKRGGNGFGSTGK